MNFIDTSLILLLVVELIYVAVVFTMILKATRKK